MNYSSLYLFRFINRPVAGSGPGWRYNQHPEVAGHRPRTNRHFYNSDTSDFPAATIESRSQIWDGSS